MTSSSPATTHEAALTLLLRQGEASAGELAEQLELSVQVMRRHLRSLEDKGLVEASPQATAGDLPAPAGGTFQMAVNTLLWVYCNR
jgi:DeoR family suf operon transcriptional repressor